MVASTSREILKETKVSKKSDLEGYREIFRPALELGLPANTAIFPVYYPNVLDEIKEFIRINEIKIMLDFEKFSFNLNYNGWKIIFAEDGEKRRGKSPSEGLHNTLNKARGLNIMEGVWLSAMHPELLDRHSIDLIGSKYSIECIPTIYKWGNSVHLSAICPDVSDMMCGAPTILFEKEVGEKDITNKETILRIVKQIKRSF